MKTQRIWLISIVGLLAGGCMADASMDGFDKGMPSETRGIYENPDGTYTVFCRDEMLGTQVISAEDLDEGTYCDPEPGTTPDDAFSAESPRQCLDRNGYIEHVIDNVPAMVGQDAYATIRFDGGNYYGTPVELELQVTTRLWVVVAYLEPIYGEERQRRVRLTPYLLNRAVEAVGALRFRHPAAHVGDETCSSLSLSLGKTELCPPSQEDIGFGCGTAGTHSFAVAIRPEGRCNLGNDWKELTFPALWRAPESAELSVPHMLCGGGGFVVELKVADDTWTRIYEARTELSCGYQDASMIVPPDDLSQAYESNNALTVRVRGNQQCNGTGCMGFSAPCVRNVTLSVL